MADSSKVNDEEIGYSELDEKLPSVPLPTPVSTSLSKLKKTDGKPVVEISPAEPSQDDQVETDKVYEVFLNLAGVDKEVDWKELKQILDYSMKDELELKQGLSYKKGANSLNAAPPGENSSNAVQTENESGILTQLIGLICGHFCKDTPLAEIIPKPMQNTSLMATFADLTKNGFSKDICRSMIAMMDADRSGKLGYEEFKTLWIDLRNWKNAWTLYDADKSGTFSGFELREALHSAGYRLNNRVLNVLMHRYGSKNAEIQFDDFIMCALKVKTMIDLFRTKDQTSSDIATFSLEEWLENTLYT